MCKINPNKPHLLSNFLPCGNSVCIKCILSSYKIYKRIFNCEFESCRKEHKFILEQLESDLTSIKLIENNLFYLLFKISIDNGDI